MDCCVFEKVCGKTCVSFFCSEILRVFVVRGSGPDAGSVQSSAEGDIVPALLCALFGVRYHERQGLRGGQATVSKDPGRSVSPK